MTISALFIILYACFDLITLVFHKIYDSALTCREELLPMADLVTPNVKEASALLGGMPLKKNSDMRHAATLIHQMGSK